jgi:WASH complex subunit strumpellin
LNQSLSRLDKFIIEGQLIEEYALDHTKELMLTLREANTTLRWLMLHKSCKNKVLKQIIDDPANKTAREKDIVKLILYLSKYEHIMKDIFTNLVTQKTQIWADDKAKCVENMNEIAEYFSGNRNWGKANIDENYAGWFRNLTTMIDGLDFKHSTKTGRKIQQIS